MWQSWFKIPASVVKNRYPADELQEVRARARRGDAGARDRCRGGDRMVARAMAMTKRQRTVPYGHVDEAVIEKLMSSFGAAMNECLPTGSEIYTAAVRLIILGLHVHLTNGDPSATTPEIQARLETFGDKMRDLIQAVEQESAR